MNESVTYDLSWDHDFAKFPRFEAFFGNNHHRIVNHHEGRCGLADLTTFVGQSIHEVSVRDELWDMLLKQFYITRMRVYRPNEGQWCDCTPEGGCIIQLDENDCFKSIAIHPHRPRWEDYLPKRKNLVANLMVKEECGAAVINTYATDKIKLIDAIEL